MSDLKQNPALDYVGSAKLIELSSGNVDFHSMWINQAELMKSWAIDKNETIICSSYFGFGFDKSIVGYFVHICNDPVHGGWETFEEASIDFRQGFENGTKYATYYNAYFWSTPCFFWLAGTGRRSKTAQA